MCSGSVNRSGRLRAWCWTAHRMSSRPLDLVAAPGMPVMLTWAPFWPSRSARSIEAGPALPGRAVLDQPDRQRFGHVADAVRDARVLGAGQHHRALLARRRQQRRLGGQDARLRVGHAERVDGDARRRGAVVAVALLEHVLAARAARDGLDHAVELDLADAGKTGRRRAPAAWSRPARPPGPRSRTRRQWPRGRAEWPRGRAGATLSIAARPRR